MTATSPPKRHTPRPATVGTTRVARPLPQRSRRTIGHWCFVDVFTPGVGTDPAGISGVGPHPHCGLQTVTWLTDGAVEHTDSLGSSQRVRPGELNLMTAGHGITHAEAAVPRSGPTHGAQLWLAQPDRTRHDAPRFAHHPDLPHLDVGPGVTGVVMVGPVEGIRSPAQIDAPAVSVALSATNGGTGTLPLDPLWEHGVIVLDGHATLGGPWEGGGVSIPPGTLVALGPGHEEIGLGLAPATTALVLGGEPLTDQLLMWWNFVVRTRDEALEATDAWNRGDPRFGPPPRSPDPRATAPVPPWDPSH